MIREQRRDLPVPQIQFTRQETLGLDNLIAQAHKRALSGKRLEISFDDFARLFTGEESDLKRAQKLISPVFGEFIKHGGSVGFNEKTSMFGFRLPPEARIVSAVRENVLEPYLPTGLRIDEGKFRHELRSLRAFGEAVRKGIVSLPETSQILATPPDSPRRVEAGRNLARAVLLPFLQRNDKPDKVIRRFRKDTRGIISFIGVENYRTAVSRLSDLETRLTTENLSVTFLLFELGCLDIEYCNEEQIAVYLRRIAFYPRKQIRWENLSRLFEVAAERTREGEIEPEIIFGELDKIYYGGSIIKQLVAAAYEHGTQAELSSLLVFARNEEWARMGRLLAEDEDYYADRVVSWRKERGPYERKTVYRT